MEQIVILKALEESGLQKKGSIFGGESSLYENLEDMKDPTKQGDFGDTWLGDLLGFDEDGFGVQGDSLKDSLRGSRRDGKPSSGGGSSQTSPTSSAAESSSSQTFSEAFAAARAEQGAGGTFEYEGKSYSTNTAEEEEPTP